LRENRNEMSGGLPSRESKNLAHPDYDVLLRRLDSDSKRSSEKYENLRRVLLKFFECNNCWGEAEHLVDVTLDVVARKPSEFVIENVGAYSHVVARYVLMGFKRPSPRVVPLGDLPEIQGPNRDHDANIDHQRELDCLNQCLRQLNSRNRDLVLEYYSSQESTHITHRQELARTFGISMNNLRVKAKRIREGLEDCVKRRLASGER
jgi:DNA-directed RNA polymerase specialized sigma24 family protein